MDCQKARKLIDERVDAGSASPPETAAKRDWSELDAHLAQCSRCRADCAELLRARGTLGDVANDEPTNQEIESMWAAIQTALPAAKTIMPTRAQRRTIWTYAASTLGAAAALLLIFQLGQWHYGTVRLQAKRAADAASPRPEFTKGGLMDVDGDGARDRWRGLRSVGVEIAGKEITHVPVLGQVLGPRGQRGEEPRDKGVAAGRYQYDNAINGPAARGFRGESFGRAVLGPADGAGFFVRSTAERISPPELAKVAEIDTPTERYSFGYATGEFFHRSKDAVGPPAPPAAGVSESPVERLEALLAGAAEKVEGLLPPPATTTPPTPPAAESKVPAERGSADGAPRGYVVPSWERIEEWLDALDRQVPGASGQQPPVLAAPRSRPKVIKTGNLGLEVDEYVVAAQRVHALASQHGAFVADGSSQEQTGGALLGRVVIRVPPERFEALFAAIKTVGRVEGESVKAADVTAEYVDLEARIQSLQIAEQRLRELMQSKSFMDKISALLEVERELTRVRSEIEQLQGQLRVMADRVAMSTITVTLREPARTVPSASLSVEVPVLADAEIALGTALTDLDGRLTSGQTSKRDDGTLMGDYKLSVSLARFAQLLAAVDGFGRIEARQIKDRQFADATAPWADQVRCNVALVLYERSRQLPQGTVTLEVEAVADALTGLDPVLSASGGAIISNRTTRRDDGSSVAELDLRVPAGRFADLITGLEPLGRTTAKQVAGEAGRIVGGAANVQCQVTLTLAEPAREVPSGGMVLEIGKFEDARQQLSAMIAANNVQVLSSTSQQRTDGTSFGTFRLGIKAGDMEAVVSKLESLGRVASRQITGLGLGDLSQIAPDALGVIELTLAEKATISPEPRRAGDSIRHRLRDGLAGLYASLGLILYGVILLAPWAVIVLFVAWLVARRLRRRRSVPVPASGTAEGQ